MADGIAGAGTGDVPGAVTTGAEAIAGEAPVPPGERIAPATGDCVSCGSGCAGAGARGAGSCGAAFSFVDGTRSGLVGYLILDVSSTWTLAGSSWFALVNDSPPITRIRLRTETSV